MCVIVHLWRSEDTLWSLCVCMSMYVSAHMWRSEDTLWELTVFFQCEGPGIDLRVSVLVASTFPC